jgi:hypothetical protein
MPATSFRAPVDCGRCDGGRGKRGGSRVIYYYVVAHSQIRMILIYRKGIKDDLTPKEKVVLRKLNEDWK